YFSAHPAVHPQQHFPCSWPGIHRLCRVKYRDRFETFSAPRPTLPTPPSAYPVSYADLPVTDSSAGGRACHSCVGAVLPMPFLAAFVQDTPVVSRSGYGRCFRTSIQSGDRFPGLLHIFYSGTAHRPCHDNTPDDPVSAGSVPP